MLKAHILGAATYGLAVLAPQVTALITLAPAEFGRFSLLYLLYALALSSGLSVVVEPWHLRNIDNNSDGKAWGHFAGAAFIFSAIAGLSTFAVAPFLDMETRLGMAASTALAIGVFRSLTRYYLAQQAMVVRLLSGDVLFLGVFLASLLGVTGVGVEGIYASWAIAGFAAVLVMPWPARRGKMPGGWMRAHGPIIRRLLPDSILMDAGAVGAPMLVAAILDAASFGIFRAVSNVAAPVRMVVDPLRPYLMLRSRARGSGSFQMFWWTLLIGATMGLFGFIALFFIPWASHGIDVLAALSAFAFPAGLTVAMNFVSHVYYVFTRGAGEEAGLLRGRLLQTIVMVVLPLGGTLVDGLRGGIWGYALASAATACIWCTLSLRRGAADTSVP